MFSLQITVDNRTFRSYRSCVVRLGCGFYKHSAPTELKTSRTLYRSSYKAERVATELDNLLNKPQYALKAREVGARLRGENGAATDLQPDRRVLEWLPEKRNRKRRFGLCFS